MIYQKLAPEMLLNTCDNDFLVEDDSPSVCPESGLDAASRINMDLVSLLHIKILMIV